MVFSSGRASQIGIIGGGQLALMLSDAAYRLGLNPISLAKNSFDPVAWAHPNSIFGSVLDEQALACLFSQVKHVIFENEFVDCSLLERVAAKWDCKFVPTLEVIAKVQDKLIQKSLFQDLNIPSAEFEILDENQSLASQV